MLSSDEEKDQYENLAEAEENLELLKKAVEQKKLKLAKKIHTQAAVIGSALWFFSM